MEKNSYFKFVAVFLVIIALGVGGYFIFRGENQTEKAERGFRQYEEAMRADTYGGKTPQETLDLFIEALRAEDIELASKYFLYDDNLSKQKWVDRLNEIKNKGLLEIMANDIETRAKEDVKNKISENDFKFVLYADNEQVGARIDMQFNTYSGVWKIESL
ncbi:MAG: hypothetical protein HYT03_01330 [Candidatus Harrisonbacteria bacterium]|nr:hypothetical protein [Candidatus Harrisonbacteria bacterium]